MFGHVELFTEEIQEEYIEWMKNKKVKRNESMVYKICADGRNH